VTVFTSKKKPVLITMHGTYHCSRLSDESSACMAGA